MSLFSVIIIENCTYDGFEAGRFNNPENIFARIDSSFVSDLISCPCRSKKLIRWVPLFEYFCL